MSRCGGKRRGKAGQKMQYIFRYLSPLGEMTMAGSGERLTGLWFCGQKYDRAGLESGAEEKELPVFLQTKQWLDCYFSGQEPAFTPPLLLPEPGFRRTVTELLLTVPYGHTVTYGELAREAARRRGLNRMSARAVGGAVSRNPLSILIPCHRVVGKNGSLTGYAGGVERKMALLKGEGVDMSRFVQPAGKSF